VQLPPCFLAVFLPHDVEGREHEKIARMPGVAMGTSRSRLHKARMKRRGLLKKHKLISLPAYASFVAKLQHA
jgi:RNA polymerase sigma-70 factor, ECF subfamily